MARRFARAEGGARAIGSAPKNWGKNVSLIGALTLEGLTSTMSIDGSVDGDVFAIYVEQVLGPALRPGDVVVMDNLNVHKGPAISRAIEAHGARLMWLPPYSPDFNPIEQAWLKIKTALRSAAARSREALDQAITHAIQWVTRQDAIAWFQGCGYQPQLC